MNTYKLTFLFLFVFIFVNCAVSQEDIVEINNTDIIVPQVYDFGDVDVTSYTKYIIKNNRNAPVNVKEVKTPAGFFANISDMNIAAGKKVILYIGLDPSFVEKEGVFENDIIIKTNLIMDIVIKVKGNIIKKTE